MNMSASLKCACMANWRRVACFCGPTGWRNRAAATPMPSCSAAKWSRRAANPESLVIFHARALIHHWVRTVFIPGASLVECWRSSGLRPPQDGVQARSQSKMVEHNGGDFKVHYRLRKKKVVTIILDTDYEVHRHSIDTTHAYSNSYSTQIAQVENAGEADEHVHELPPGKDGGYIGG